MDPILNFVDEFFFLSNFFERPIKYNGLEFLNNEAAFQSGKTEDPFVFCGLNANDARKRGRSISIHYPDWNTYRLQVMVEVVHAKFTQHKDLRDLLCATGDRELVEGNWWGDKFWGKVAGEGENWLGSILMAERAYWLKLKEVRAKAA